MRADASFPCPHCQETVELDLADDELSGSVEISFDCYFCDERISLYASLDVRPARRDVNDSEAADIAAFESLAAGSLEAARKRYGA